MLQQNRSTNPLARKLGRLSYFFILCSSRAQLEVGIHFSVFVCKPFFLGFLVLITLFYMSIVDAFDHFH